ncbi:hypothetical protein N0V88_004390 [Collariella sp. IMI 366227]|nr:hypothetical protein N0V88_004390 [Collariella sp. IMI 366227]
MSFLNSKPVPPNQNDSSSEEEDYMNMTFADPVSSTSQNTKAETSLQRRLRLRREAEARSRPKSKSELAAEAEARREAALSQSLFDTQPKSKGLAMMSKMGFKAGGALGRQQPVPAPAGRGPRTEPIRIEIKDGREDWIGERAEAEDAGGGLVKGREEKERDRRMRYDLEQGLARLPTYEDAEEDEDDKKALGKKHTAYVTAEDLDEEDTELEDFNALPPDERLQKLVEHLREEYHYCFWCKFAYPDEEMEGCPGLTEEDHD